MIFKFFKNKFKNKMKVSKIGDFYFKKNFMDATKKELVEDVFRGNILSIAYLLYKNGNVKEINNSSSRFNEFIDRLLIRYSEIKEIEWELYYIEEIKEPRNMRDIQSDFVNRTESFHQQLYATIGAFINLLNNSNSSNFIKDMPFSSTSHFLNYIKKEIPNLKQDIERLLKSTNEYRSTFIDHTNQNPNHDWSTNSALDGKAHIIYYIGKGEGKLLQIPELSFGGLKIYTSFPTMSYFIPPHPKETMNSFTYLISEILSLLKKEQEKVQ